MWGYTHNWNIFDMKTAKWVGGEGDGGERAAEDAEQKPQVLGFGGDIASV